MIRVFCLIAALATCAALPARADQTGLLPGLFDVSGVAANDVLNIRARPDAAAPVIGVLAPGQVMIEIVARSDDGGWGLVNTGEASGWANLRYLVRREVPRESQGLPPHLACFGTEPFWAMTREAGQIIYDNMNTGRRPMELLYALGRDIAGDQTLALAAQGMGMGLSAAITPAACNDGMSDRAYGLSVILVTDSRAGPELFTGCCTLAP
jgi:uncharacterized membrane protein